jgi:hypothetical protein
MTNRAKVYRNIELRQQLFGLEPLDGLGLAALFGVLALFNPRGPGWDLLALALAYVALRIFKRGKPEGYTVTLLRFYFRRPFLSAGPADGEVAAHPFPFAGPSTRAGIHPNQGGR